ncbi:MAG: response regulator transcription factor [Janthinobacterium lividum]
MRVLLVEDHAGLRDMLQSHLRQVGYDADAVECGRDALAAVAATRYDAVILDLGLPDLDGMEVLRRLRATASPQVPVLILSARQALDDRVNGLDAGADDYLPKPFDLPELDARLRSITRRTETQDRLLRFGDLRLDATAREAFANDAGLGLTRLEVTLLEALLRDAGRLLARDMLEDRLYGIEAPRTGNALEALMSRLRRRLAVARSTVSVETVRGIGYRLVLARPPVA